MNIRQMWLIDREQMDSLRLTTHRVKVITFIRKNPDCTSKSVSIVFKISLANSSTLLIKLTTLGYLKRRQFDSISGGIEYSYRAIPLRNLT